MKLRTRRLLIQVATGIAVAATAALMLAPATASAQSPAQVAPGGGLPTSPGGSPAQVVPKQPNFSFGIQIGPRPGFSFGIGAGTGEVCFYSRTNFRGDGFCVDEGNTIRDLGEWTDAIGSFDNPDGLSVTLCTDTRLRGRCAVYTTSARSLGRFDGNLASLRVR